MNRYFESTLARLNPKGKSRRSLVYVPCDQLTDRIGPLASEAPESLAILLIESGEYWGRRPHHRQKLGFVLGNQRAFALEQARRGVLVHYVRTGSAIGKVLSTQLGDLGPARVMTPAEWEQRLELQPLIADGLLKEVPHDGWLTSRRQFTESVGKDGKWRMDAFYRLVRNETGILMDKPGKPVGGKYSYDADNREAWKGTPPAPELPRFPEDELRKELKADIESLFERHPGKLDLQAIPLHASEAMAWWNWAKSNCLVHFGQFEDAMSTASTGLFHTRLSPLINVLRLLPRDIVEETLGLELPLNSKEGFVRQILGWREYVRHVHEVTEGFRQLPSGAARVADHPGDGGYSLWKGQSWVGTNGWKDSPYGGAMPNILQGYVDVPPALWGEPSGMNCLDTVVRSVWEEGWSHHITRLMVISNICTLLGVEPRQLADWFWVAYVDAWDWVVEPNVLGMGTYGVGDIMTTKPYVGGASYINKMSNYCGDCAFSPDGNCPIKRLYWAFLAEHEDALSGNPRMWNVLGGLRRRTIDERQHDRTLLLKVREILLQGETLTPKKLQGAAPPKRK
jgi:deoxyribodipyrimidine photolyase-related protein